MSSRRSSRPAQTGRGPRRPPNRAARNPGASGNDLYRRGEAQQVRGGDAGFLQRSAEHTRHRHVKRTAEEHLEGLMAFFLRKLERDAPTEHTKRMIASSSAAIASSCRPTRASPVALFTRASLTARVCSGSSESQYVSTSAPNASVSSSRSGFSDTAHHVQDMRRCVNTHPCSHALRTPDKC